MKDQKINLASENKESMGLGERDPFSNILHWRELSPRYSFLNKKIILCLPGDGANTPSKSNGSVKIIEEALPLSLRERFHFLGVYYKNVKSAAAHRVYLLKKTGQLKDRLDAVQRNRDFCPTYYEDFFNTYLKPLIETPAGKRRTLTEAKKNMKNLIMVGHCHGSAVAFQLERCFIAHMNRLKYSVQEQEEIQRQLIIFAFASRIPVSCSHSTVFHIVSQGDKQKESNWRIENFQEYLNQLKTEEQKTILLPWSRHEAVLSTKQLVISSKDFLPDPQNPFQSWDHTLYAFIGKDGTVPGRTPGGKEIVRSIRSLMRTVIENDSDREEIQDIFDRLPYQRLVLSALAAGKEAWIKYKERRMAYCMGRTRIFRLIQDQDVDGLKNLVERLDIPLDLRNEKGLFPIHAAIYKNNPELVNFVCHHTKEWYNLVTPEGESPLIYALLYQRFDIAKHLWDALSENETAENKSMEVAREVKRSVLLFTIKNMVAHPVLRSFFDEVSQESFPMDKEDTVLFLETIDLLKEKKEMGAQKTAAFIEGKVYSFLKKLPPKLFFNSMYRYETSLADELCRRSKDEKLHRLVYSKKIALVKQKNGRE